MMSPRFTALKIAGERQKEPAEIRENAFDLVAVKSSFTTFGSHQFGHSIMQKMLPKEVYKNLLNASQGREKIKPEYADAIAVAMKEWAISLGATHYSHWFQPLTGATAEKHDTFMEWNGSNEVIEKFNGKQLLQGEPDASSFPSGGLRSTYEARGYTGWDPTSFPFIWKAGDGVTLCIPSIFFSWTGEVLDSKIPLLRSDKQINDAILRVLKLTGIEAHQVYSTLGLEQEYFVIDRALRNLRPDLILMGRTVFGAPPAKGQELQDHYFGAVKDRILQFMHDFERAALQLGIPVKTRHNEVAPAQHEIAPAFEKASLAVDHNLLLMELMRQIAVKHRLSCLLHEKPFHGLNGSGKHSNWSLATDTGHNLLDPSDTPENQLHFLILLTAILNAIHEHAALLRASIGSAANDCRLGGHEAPPAIISVYLGEALERLLDDIEATGNHVSAQIKGRYDLNIPMIPELPKDNTDRNRTSPFAFTGNKFEFRAVGSSSNPAFPITVLNLIVAESLHQMLDEIEGNLSRKADKKVPSKRELTEAVMPVIRKYLKKSKHIRFSGNNYSEAWVKEAKRRHLPNFQKSIDAFNAYKSERTIDAFKGILTKEELASRYDIVVEQYVQTIHIETNLMIEMFRTHVFPSAMAYQKELAESLIAYRTANKRGMHDTVRQQQLLKTLGKNIEKALLHVEELEKEQQRAATIQTLSKKGHAYSNKVLTQCERLREVVDQLEMMIDDRLWHLPKYRELLFMV